MGGRGDLLVALEAANVIRSPLGEYLIRRGEAHLKATDSTAQA